MSDHGVVREIAKPFVCQLLAKGTESLENSVTQKFHKYKAICLRDIQFRHKNTQFFNIK